MTRCRRSRRGWLVAGCVFALATGCGDDVGPIGDAGPGADAGPGTDAGPMDAGPGRDATPGDAAMPDGGEPPPPPFPEVIDHLSFAVLTGSGTNDGTSANMLSLCLTETVCFRMNVADVNDFRVGEMDVYHFDGVDLARADVDRVELRSESGTDAWRPACVEVRFDGEPVHCSGGPYPFFGNGAASEVASYVDPEGLHQGCVTCYPATLTHGPLVGATTPTSTRVLVRTDATRRTRVVVTNDAAPRGTHARVLYPSPTDDFTAVFDFGGLTPATEYVVDVEIEGAVVGSGRLTTGPPAAAPGVFRFAFGSCTRDVAQPIFAQIEESSPDVFLFVGDNHYANSPDLQSLWWFYRRQLEVPERASLARVTPTLAIWDDHDYVGNNTGGAAVGKELALRAFGDYWANPSIGLPEEPGVYFRASWGDVDFFMLDNRYMRGTKGVAGATLIGPEQAAWLERELLASTATFKIIGSGTTFSQTGGETWRNYPASRDRLFHFIRDNAITGVVLIAGDVHRSQLRRILRPDSYDLPEVVSSPMANDNSTCPLTAAPDADQLACVDSSDYFATLDVDTTLPDPRIIARIVNVTGTQVASMTILRSELE